MIDPHRFYTLTQVADILSVSVLTLQRMAAAGVFRSGDEEIPITGIWVKVGSRWRVPGWWLLRLVGDGEVQQPTLF